MSVYLVTLLLLNSPYNSHAQKKNMTHRSTEATWANQSKLLSEEIHDYVTLVWLPKENRNNVRDHINLNKMGNIQETESNKSIIDVDLNNQQYITVDATNISHAETVTISNKINTIVKENSPETPKAVVVSNTTNKKKNCAHISKTQKLDKNSQIKRDEISNDYSIQIVRSKIKRKDTANIAEVKKIATNVTMNETVPTEDPYAILENIALKKYGTTTNLPCDAVISKICSYSESLRWGMCEDDTIIPLEELCDDYSPCRTKATCVLQVKEKLELAFHILSEINNRTECLPQDMEYFLMVEQIVIWQTVIISQWQHHDVKWKISSLMIGPMFDSFELLVCKHKNHTDLVTEDLKKVEADFELLFGNRVDNKLVKWSSASCTCDYQYCKFENCDNRCRYLCWQVHALDHYTCQSVTGNTSISLDFLCDGKIDCMDESDETSCTKESSIYKHKADVIYNKLIEKLSSLETIHKYGVNEMEELTNLVHQLQDLTVNTPNPDIHSIKILRDKYFKILVKIFKELWPATTEIDQLHYAYDFLFSLNQNMVKALKSSFTGNKYVASSETCYCRDDVCASIVCTQKCNQYCSVQTAFSKFTCDNKTFVDTEAICNGKKECANGEDEADCKHGVCRARHLDKLRLILRKVEMQLKNNVFDKVLDNFKYKTAHITILSEFEEPNRKTLEDRVNRILRELIEIYLIVSETNKPDLQLKLKVAFDMVKNTLKLCSK